jgi:uncharacterized membrane protein YebE (DUF533 family)
MDAIDLLGSLLGASQGQAAGGGGGLAGKILADMISGGASKPSAAPASRSAAASRTAPRNASRSAPNPRPAASVEQQARELEELLGVATGRAAGRTAGQTAGQRQAPPTAPVSRPAASSRPTAPSQTAAAPSATRPAAGPRLDQFDSSPQPKPAPAAVSQESPIPGELDANEEAILLIRAMIAAAKSDGRITADEQQNIVGRIGQPTPEVVEFLKQEFARPVDVRELAWSVPLGLEPKVYMMSLAAIDLDTQAEADYLMRLAHGLRLDPAVCNDIHARLGAPTIF